MQKKIQACGKPKNSVLPDETINHNFSVVNPMKPSLLLCPFLLLQLASPPALSQLTIGSGLTPVPGETLNYTFVEADTITPQSPGQDFYPYVVNDSGAAKFTYLTPASTPLDDSITNTAKNLSLQNQDAFSYYSSEASAWSAVGYASALFVVNYEKPLPLFRYPLELGITYSDSTTAVFFNAGVEVRRSAKVETTVDADGFLQVTDTLQNTKVSGSCIRVEVIETYRDDHYLNGLFYQTYVTSIASYYWISNDPEEIIFIHQTITVEDVAEPANNTSRTLARYHK
jgi:hypothetical protein